MGKLRKFKGGTKPGASGKKKAPKRGAKGSKKMSAKRFLPPNRVTKAAKQIVDNYTGGAASTLIGADGQAYTVTQKHKRINPMNAKAARRAATRVRSSIRMLERLKASLPRVSTKGRVVAPVKRRR